MDIAQSIAHHLRPGDILTLTGDLGAGKTTFAKGLGSALDIDETMNSPTFTIVKEYNGRIPLYHMDVYRVEHGDDLDIIDEYFESDGIVVIEWPDHIQSILPSERLDISIRYIDERTRLITLDPNGLRYDEICKEIKS